jgi:hypothetical protein
MCGMSAVKHVDPLHGMSAELREEFLALPARVRRTYLAFREQRLNRRGAHRDQLEAFVAGYFARPRRLRQVA